VVGVTGAGTGVVLGVMVGGIAGVTEGGVATLSDVGTPGAPGLGGSMGDGPVGPGSVLVMVTGLLSVLTAVLVFGLAVS
jgi:hypothetical protein